MSKAPISPERKVGLAAAALALALVGIVGAAQFSNAHDPAVNEGDRAVATAVTAADPTPAPISPAQAPSRPALITQASGDPLLARGFGHLRLSAPTTYANLTVYPVVQTSASPAPLPLTAMDSALGNNLLSIVEPSLSVTNAGPQPTYVPGGEVVPGGNQDQGVASDALIPAHSQSVAVNSFCVEPHRSSGPSPVFQHDVAFAIPAVRSAMAIDADQEQVWREVAFATAHFDAHSDTGTYHALLVSPSALAAAAPYTDALSASPSPGHVVGIVVAINGHLICADIYRDPALFAQLRPALLRSYALQAAMCPPSGSPDSAITPAAASQWLLALDAAPGAQGVGANGTEAARVAIAQGAGVRTAATLGPKTLLHEAFWTSDANLPN